MSLKCLKQNILDLFKINSVFWNSIMILTSCIYLDIYIVYAFVAICSIIERKLVIYTLPVHYCVISCLNLHNLDYLKVLQSTFRLKSSQHLTQLVVERAVILKINLTSLKFSFNFCRNSCKLSSLVTARKRWWCLTRITTRLDIMTSWIINFSLTTKAWSMWLLAHGTMEP